MFGLNGTEELDHRAEDQVTVKYGLIEIHTTSGSNVIKAVKRSPRARRWISTPSFHDHREHLVKVHTTSGSNVKVSVTTKKSPNVCKSCPKMISVEK